MVLSNDLISQFVKVTTDNKKTRKEETVYGTVVVNGGSKYVRLDGSELLTPISETADTKNGERVTVMIKNHSATVTGNISSPAARVDDLGSVPEINDKIDEFEIILAEKVDVSELNAANGRIDQLVSEDITVKNRLTANEGHISNLTTENVTINEKLNANDASIKTLKTEKLDATAADIKFAEVEDLNATNAIVYNLKSTYGAFEKLTTEKLTAADASIDDLYAKKLTATDADIKYANIDFSNIGKAALEEFFAKSGLIKDVVIGDATISGNLVGVTISGDLIEGNTVKAEKLVIKGTDGLYYKLNTDGMKIEAQQTDQNSINGTVIKAKSITATKISVSDLVAFDATIGGFKITEDSIYSGVKESVNNGTNGVYFGDDGQFSVGGTNRYIKFYKDSNGEFKLAISADSINFEAKDFSEDIQHVENSANEALSMADSNESRLTLSESKVTQLYDMISMMVTDENGSSLMTQTSTGWTFDLSGVQKTIGNAATKLNDLSGSVDGIDNTISNLSSLIDDLSKKTAYIIMTTDDDGNPCIELGKQGDAFKVRITNTAVDFLEGSSRIAYVNNKSLYIERAVIKDELQIGEGSGYVWKKRSNGNLGLRWIGG